MTYSNEDFERFQEVLRRNRAEDPLLWDLRDALFAEAFYGRKRPLEILLGLPGGWVLSLALHWLREIRAARHFTIPEPLPGASHFLFLSSRNNHTRRLLPVHKEQRLSNHCIAWCTIPDIFNLADPEQRGDFVSVAGRWARNLRLRDIRDALARTARLTRLFPGELDRRARSGILMYLVQFAAWRRFWIPAIGREAAMAISTFEKAAHVKSFYHAAREAGVPRRIHWIHGLRHSSIQATLATELWCMTPGDVRFFRDRIPAGCTAMVVRNPEADELIEKIGTFDQLSIQARGHARFLFLGPGKEASYTKAMRMADLAIIRKAQSVLGNLMEWRFRPHPSAIERFREELHEADIHVQDFSSRPLNEDLEWADAVGSSWSSLLLDISETGRPIFWIQEQIRSLGSVDELIADGIGTHVGSENPGSTISRVIFGENIPRPA